MRAARAGARKDPASRLLLIFLAVTLVVSAFPFFYLLSTALRPRSEIFHYPPTWLPQTWAWKNFAEIWTAVPLMRYLLNSLTVAGGATVLNLVVAVPAGYALARFRFPGRALFRQLLLVTQMFSPVVLIIGLFRLVSGWGLIDQPIVLVVTYAALSVAFSVSFLAGYFSSIPEEIEEAAMVDGCSRITALFRVVLPMAMPAVVTATVFAFIFAWNDFMISLTFVSSPDHRTLPLGLYSFLGQYTVQWHYLMAASLVTIVPVVVLFLLIEKHLVRGLTAGAVK
jgi:multiple sugar transport system permease protein